MIAIKKIMFPTDFSESADAALGMALLLAKNFEAELIMFHSVVLHSDDVGEDVYSRFPDLNECISMLIENADSKLEKTIDDSGRLTVKQIVRRGLSTVDEILNYANEEKVDLLVMGTHGRRGISHFLLGSVTEQVVRAADCPVLTIRKSAAASEKNDIRRILLPIDFSEDSVLAARYSNVLCKILDARLEVIHVIDSNVHPAYASVGIDTPSKLDSELKPRVEGAIKEFMSKAQTSIDYKITVRDGNPAKEISACAEDQDDTMIIIASHGEGYLERMIMGSTTERVIRLSKCPVLTVKLHERGFVH